MNHENETFSDDRLLAFALGLDDDPGLETAVSGDPELSRRLDAMRADVGLVTAGLDRVVPTPPDGYTDLSDERWGELRSLATAPAPAASRRRSAWLRVLAPAAAIVLVLVAGVVGLQRLGDGGAGDAMTTGTGDKAAERYGDGATQGEATDGGGAALPTLGRGAPDPAAYETIVVARAASPAAGRQRFEVLRVLRGKAGAYVTLKVTDRAAAPFTLQVLYLHPTEERTPGVVPSPGTSAEGAPPDTDTIGIVLEFLFKGESAVAQQLPGGTDPAEVTLP